MLNLNLADHLYDNHSSEDGLYRYYVGDYPLASLFRYRGMIRKLILNFKIKGHWQSGVELSTLFAEDEFVQFWSHEADFIMAVPSSFWGRWRGKHDLAAALAEKLCETVKVPLLEAPRRRFFRFKKQSFLSLSERLRGEHDKRILHSENGILELRNGQIRDTRKPDSAKPLVLLVDDIVTSARTLRSLADSMPHVNFRFVTLATAYRARRWEDDL